MHYVEGTAAVVQCTSRNISLGVQIDQTLSVHPEIDVFMNDITITNLRNSPLDCKFILYASFDFDARQIANTCYFDSESSLLTFFAADRYVSITCDASVGEFSVDQSSIAGMDSVFQKASTGTFNSHEYAIGQVSGAISYDFGCIKAQSAIERHISLCFARSLDEVTALATSISTTKPKNEEAVAWWNRQYAHAQLDIGPSIVRNVYDRSLMVLRLMTDSETGGVIAAPEIDADFRSCGGYGFCWPRDGAFVGHTLDMIGQHEHARNFYNWALQVQETSGVWYQRYYVNRQLAPVWGLVQFDETGAVVWSICRHIQLTKDSNYGRKVFSQLVQACEYMYARRDPETGLAPITKDLWEERDGISTYACASTWGGFSELSQVAMMLGETIEAQRWSSAAADLKTAIETHLWDVSHQRFLRGLNTKLDLEQRERLRNRPGSSEPDTLEIEIFGKTHYLHRYDDTIDASILGLSVPFGVFPAKDPRMMATADAIANYLISPGGGIRRYEDDTYRNGNPWVICTLWLALQDLAAGQKERAQELYQWVIEHRTSLDLLPEQVDPVTGKPCWVVPLAWSHAMFILTTRVLLEQGLL
ncbi:MAG: glycoside hydrolase family 15 protein [Chloroflexota bacterium]|nr:glycoside hydrolase family 15 protein [Chloroflexota bacterium]